MGFAGPPIPGGPVMISASAQKNVVGELKVEDQPAVNVQNRDGVVATRKLNDQIGPSLVDGPWSRTGLEQDRDFSGAEIGDHIAVTVGGRARRPRRRMYPRQRGRSADHSRRPPE